VEKQYEIPFIKSMKWIIGRESVGNPLHIVYEGKSGGESVRNPLHRVDEGDKR